MTLIDDYYSVDEAAKELGVHLNTIRNWYRNGVLTPYRPNPARYGRVYLKKSEVKKLMSNTEVMSEVKE